jgi:hypothetical protein
LVVNKLLEYGEKILVLMPAAYTQKVIPNSTQKKGRRTSQITPEDEEILEGLRNNSMLYIVPYSSDDDCKFVYAFQLLANTPFQGTGCTRLSQNLTPVRFKWLQTT